jgi:hypothetical protein
MNANQVFIRKAMAVMLLVFPLILMLGFALHFSSLESFFRFRLQRPVYHAERMFDMVVRGYSHGFLVAHFVVYLAVPLMMLVILSLAWLLFRQMPLIAFTGAVVGIIGCVATAGVIAAWLSFPAVGRVSPEYYDGARAALIELTRMTGVLKMITTASYLAFVGMIMLAAGLIRTKMFPLWSMFSIIAGSLLFLLFMDMDNWMFIGSVLILIGLIPVSRKISSGS